jgi:hypothetical protein
MRETGTMSRPFLMLSLIHEVLAVLFGNEHCFDASEQGREHALPIAIGERHPSGYHESGFGRNPAAQAPLAAKLYFDCHDALRAERKRRYEV